MQMPMIGDEQRLTLELLNLVESTIKATDIGELPPAGHAVIRSDLTEAYRGFCTHRRLF